MALLRPEQLHSQPTYRSFASFPPLDSIVLLLFFLSISLTNATDILDRRKQVQDAEPLQIDHGSPPLVIRAAMDEVDSEVSSPVGTHAQDLDTTRLLSRAATANVPTPFDTTVGDNFTTPGCKTWFSAFIRTNEVLGCVPVSLLLQTSTSFFKTARSAVTLTSTLDTSCAIDYDTCSMVMDKYALQLQQKANCLQDFTNQNPIVVQAYVGLIAYKPVYRAACLKTKDKNDNGTTAYCMMQAFTNRTAPSNSYPYYLPLGNSLPGGAIPTCSHCLADTMQGYAAYAGNATQPLSQIYRDAVQTIDLNCGPKFVNVSVPNVSGVASLRPTGSMTLLLGVLLVVFQFAL